MRKSRQRRIIKAGSNDKKEIQISVHQKKTEIYFFEFQGQTMDPNDKIFFSSVMKKKKRN